MNQFLSFNYTLVVLLFCSVHAFGQQDEVQYSLEVNHGVSSMVIIACSDDSLYFSYLEYDGQRDVYHPRSSFQTDFRSLKILDLFANTSIKLRAEEDKMYELEVDANSLNYVFVDEENPWMSPTVQGEFIDLLEDLIAEIMIHLEGQEFPYRLN